MVGKWNATCAWWNVIFVFCSIVSRYFSLSILDLTEQWLKKWNGTFFEYSPLKDLGLWMQLGHTIGEKCLNPEWAADDDFTVISTHGIQTVAIDFCGCGKSSQDHVIWLLRACLFPATIKYPKTAATFDCLETFKKLSYVSKVSAFEFYHTASRLTDDTGTKTLKVSLFGLFPSISKYQTTTCHLW